MSMIPLTKELAAYIKEEDGQRELIITRSRTILKNSKSAIYSIHRGEFKQAKQLLDDAKNVIIELRKIIKIHPHLQYNLDNALEEYAEASCFYEYQVNKKVPSFKELEVDPINYLGALSDLTGELGRKAVIEATAKNSKRVEDIRSTMEEIHGVLLSMDLRNGELRKKSDSIKWNLQKVEELLYDLKRKK
ncbi:MAG: hypothetical protein WC916_03670 [Candidatus Woesearchaeota archaeon]